MAGLLMYPNFDDPLNYGLAGWWLSLPHVYGGGRWIDLVGQKHASLITGASWGKQRPRTGGFGSMKFDGSAGYCTIPGNYGEGATSGYPFTWAVWFNSLVSDIADRQMISKTDGVSAFFQLGMDPAIRVALSPNRAISGPNVVVNTWTHVAFTYSTAAFMTLYVNGESVGTDGSAAGDFVSTDSYNFGIKSTERWSGWLDDIRFLKVAWSSSQVREYYRRTRANYAGVLSTVRPRDLNPPVQAAATGFLLRRRRTMVMG